MSQRISAALRRTAYLWLVPLVAAVLLFSLLRFARATGGYEAWFSGDIGLVVEAGTADYDAPLDEFSVSGSGVGFGGAADSGFFTYLYLHGDGSITAKVLSVENTSTGASGGLAVREGVDADDKQVIFGLRPDGSTRLIVRTTKGGTASASAVGSESFPVWIRLTRAGNNFTYSTSVDGITWIGHGTVTVVMGGIVRIGLAVSSADDGVLCPAVFQAVATTGNMDDIDLDGLSDAWEWQYFGGLMHGPGDDPDQDGLTNLQEWQEGANPANPDTDGDSIPDGWEVAKGLAPLVNDAGDDPDQDGLSNLQEFILGTNPQSVDTDGDGIPDLWEVDNGTNPRVDDAAENPYGTGISNLLRYQLSISTLAHWKLDDGTGTMATDASGHGNHGTLQNGAIWVAGSSGGAAGFDGVNDYVSVPSVDVGGEFTLVALVRLPDPGPGDAQVVLANSSGGATADGFRLLVNSPGTSDRKLVLETGNGTQTASAESSVGAVPLDAWVHVAAVVDRAAGVAKLYVDGVDVTVTGGILTDFAQESALRMGAAADDSQFLEGQLDEVQIYTRLLGVADIFALAAAQSVTPIPLSGLALWLKADQGVMADANGAVSKWLDHSGHGNTATQSTAAQKPRLIPGVINGQPALRFDGADDYLDLPTSTPTNMSLSDFRDGLTAIIVARPNVLQTSARFLTLSRGSSASVVSIAYNKPYSFTELSTNLEYYISNPSSGINTVVAWFALNEGQFRYHQFTQTPTGSGDGDVEIRGNGHLLQTGTTPLPVYNTAAPRDKNYIGRSSYASQPYLAADIAEILLYQRPLSAAERRQMDYYLYRKYRLTIDLPPPEISPASGSTDPAYITVQITAAETPPAGVPVFIRYTTDGSEPGWNSAGFTGTTGSFALTRSAVVKARMFLDASTASGTASAQYWVNDADQDGMDDAWELLHGLDPDDPEDGVRDADRDGLTNLQEFQFGTNPNMADSNDDGFTDYTAWQLGLNPNAPDSDGDGLSNTDELLHGTDPWLADTDGDGVPDNLDAYPLDPSRWATTPPNPGDITPPAIHLETPAHAVPIP